MPIGGEALESPFFETYVEEPTLSISELLESRPKARKRILDLFGHIVDQTPAHVLEEVSRKILCEVETGTMGPGMTLSEATAKYGNFFNIVPSFGIEQGTTNDGKPKVRRIDDHAACDNNAAAARRQKITMASCYTCLLMQKLVAVVFDTEAWPDPDGEPEGATDDFKAAYRQVPMTASQMMLCLTVVYHPALGKWLLHEMRGQPFGAARAVPNFYRFAEWVCRSLRRLFNLCMEHFFDDFFTVEPRWSIDSATACFRIGCRALGVQLDLDKAQRGSEFDLLGAVMDGRWARRDMALYVKPKPSRVKGLRESVSSIKKANKLAPGLAATIVGRFGFVCDQLFGRVGRAAMGALRSRSYQSHSVTALTDEIKASLSLMDAFLRVLPPRTLSLKQSGLRPTLLYTDASDVPGRAKGQYCVGAVLDSPLASTLLHTLLAVPTDVVASWIPKQTQIGQLEIFAAPVALDTWGPLLVGQEVFLFVDNTSALASLTKGFSPRADSVKLVGDFWLRACKLQLNAWIERVESKSNLSDGPSRFDAALVESLGSVFTEPSTTLISVHPCRDPMEWFNER